MAGCEHVGGVVDVDADALASIRLRDTGYMSGVTAMVEGFEVLYAGALVPPDSSGVLVRHPTPQRFVRASVQAVGDGRVLCRVDATDPVWSSRTTTRTTLRPFLQSQFQMAVLLSGFCSQPLPFRYCGHGCTATATQLNRTSSTSS